jgi:hypothetical protein
MIIARRKVMELPKIFRAAPEKFSKTFSVLS